MIIATARMRDEAVNVERFCREYGKIADMILIADGGSEDNSKELASNFNRVKIIDFPERVHANEDVWYNPQGKHTNFLIDHAIGMGAKWIIFDDMDSAPNYTLKQNFVKTIIDAEANMSEAIYCPRAYLYGDEHWFPNMTKDYAVLWAWQAKINLKFDEVVKSVKPEATPDEDDRWTLALPHALLHYFAPNEEEIQRKLEHYKVVRDHPVELHPLKFGGPVEGLPGWARL